MALSTTVKEVDIITPPDQEIDQYEAPEIKTQRYYHNTVGRERENRLQILALLAAVGFGLGAGLTVFVPLLQGTEAEINTILLLLCSSMGILSAILAFSLKHFTKDYSTEFHIVLGSVYIVISSAFMALAEVFTRPQQTTSFDGLSGICLWIVLFPIVVESRPRITALLALLSASWVPLFYYCGVAGDVELLAEHELRWFIPFYFCAAMAVLVSYFQCQQRIEMEKARKQIQEISGYRLIGKVASGGMGEIWLARHVLLQQSAAIKFIALAKENQDDSEPLSSTKLYSSFAKEARSLARLTSPHSVQIYDYGVAADGRLFLAMEYLQGFDTEELIERTGPFPEARVIHILLQLCDALDEVHASSLVHRDIKPSNIMLCRAGRRDDMVKLIDFGLAIERVNANRAEAVGTPGYVAPELLMATAAPSPASDIYAVGVCAWYWLSGHDVFSVDDDWALRHMRDEPDAEELNFIDPDLVRLILACLQKQPQHRISKIGDLRRRLEVLQQRHQWSRRDAKIWWQSNQLSRSVQKESKNKQLAVAKRA